MINQPLSASLGYLLGRESRMVTGLRDAIEDGTETDIGVRLTASQGQLRKRVTRDANSPAPPCWRLRIARVKMNAAKVILERELMMIVKHKTIVQMGWELLDKALYIG